MKAFSCPPMQKRQVKNHGTCEARKLYRMSCPFVSRVRHHVLAPRFRIDSNAGYDTRTLGPGTLKKEVQEQWSTLLQGKFIISNMMQDLLSSSWVRLCWDGGRLGMTSCEARRGENEEPWPASARDMTLRTPSAAKEPMASWAQLATYRSS